MFEKGLVAFKLLESKDFLPTPLESCNHKIDLLLLTNFGFTVEESENFIAEFGENKGDSLEFKELIRVEPKFIAKLSQEKLSRSITIWIKLNRLMNYHKLNCNKLQNLDDNFKSDLINNFSLSLDHDSLNFLIQISSTGIPIKSIGFSTRTFNALKRNNIHYLDDLLKTSDKDLSEFHNFGVQSTQEISVALLKFKEREEAKLSEPSISLEGNILLENMGFSTRTYNALKRNRIDSLNDLQKVSEADIRDIRNLGANSLKEIGEVLGRYENRNVPQEATNFKEANHLEEIYSWAKNELLKEIESLNISTYSLRDLQIRLKYFESDMFTNRGEHYFELYFGCENLGDVVQRLSEQISTSDRKNLEVLISQLDSLQGDINQYLEFKKSLFPNIEQRETILKYENENSDDRLDLLKFDRFTLDLIGLNPNKNGVFLEHDSFFELLEHLNHNFVRDKNVWDIIDGVLKFFKKYNSFPNLLGLIIGHHFGEIEEKQKIEHQLKEIINSIFIDNSERNFEVLLLRIKGDTLDSIGKQFNLTRERVRQILVKIVPDLEILAESLRTVSQTKFDQLLVKKSIKIFEQYGAIYKSELAAELDLSEEEAVNSTPKQFQKYIIDKTPEPVSQLTWTLEACLKAIRQAGTYYYPLRQSDYDDLISIGEVKGPSTASIYQRQWQWSDLCVKAGVEFVPSVRSEYVRTWSNDELLSFARRFFREPSISGSYGSYDSWRESQIDHVPSGVLIRNVFGSWTNVKRKALESIRYEKGLNVRDVI
jgi:hypothetical protein